MKYDLHIHSCYSPCSLNKPETILKKARKAGLNGIAITDHNTTKGAFRIKQLKKGKDFEIIIGEEIRTDKGDIIALYVQEEIKPGNLYDVIDRIKDQDAISIIAHPTRWVAWHKFRYPLRELEGRIDAVEVFNSRNIGWANRSSRNKIKGLDFAEIGASDAHIPLDIGKGYTVFEGSLREAIRKRNTKAVGTTRYAVLSGFLSFIKGRIISPLKVNPCN